MNPQLNLLVFFARPATVVRVFMVVVRIFSVATILNFRRCITIRLLTKKCYKNFKVDLALYEKRAAKGKRVTRELEAVFD